MACNAHDNNNNNDTLFDVCTNRNLIYRTCYLVSPLLMLCGIHFTSTMISDRKSQDTVLTVLVCVLIDTEYYCKHDRLSLKGICSGSCDK